MKGTQIQWERMAAFIFGVVFVIAMLVLSIFYPEPTAFRYLVFRTILSLAAAGIAVFLPGTLNVKVGKIIKASGAIAIFIVVFKISPAQLVVSTTIDLDPPSLSFGISDVGKNFVIKSKGPNELKWRIESGEAIKVNPAKGIIKSNSNKIISVYIDREKLKTGRYVDGLSVFTSYISENKENKIEMEITAVRPQRLEYRVINVDDQLIIKINDQQIDTITRNSEWKKIPTEYLRIGNNKIELFVYNVPSRRGNVPWGKREGWDYDVEFRVDKTLRYTGSSNGEPPTEQWGTTFNVKTIEAVFDPESGEITIIK